MNNDIYDIQNIFDNISMIFHIDWKYNYNLLFIISLYSLYNEYNINTNIDIIKCILYYTSLYMIIYRICDIINMFNMKFNVNFNNRL